MRAVVLEAYGEPPVVREVPEPEPPADGIVVAVEACGVCRSDWHAWQGHGEWANDQVPLGQVLGHEPAGRVVAVGDRVDRNRFAVGDRVAIPFNLGCGTCPQCTAGHGNVCEDGLAIGFETAAGGAFAERVAVPNAAYNAVPLPDDVTAAAAAALGCRYATAFHALVDRAAVTAGEWVAVLGCGGVGLSAVAVARAIGAGVVAVDIRDAALTLAATIGADATIDAADETPAETAAAIRAATDGGADVSMDALGSADTCRAAVGGLATRGRHVQVGLTGADERGEIALPTDEMTRWEVTFHGARGMPPTRYPALVALIARGRLDPGALVTNRIALDAVPDRLAAMTDYDTVGVEVVTEF